MQRSSFTSQDEFKGVLTRFIETIETLLKLVTAMIKFTIIASIVLSTSSALYHTIYLMTQVRNCLVAQPLARNAVIPLNIRLR